MERTPPAERLRPPGLADASSRLLSAREAVQTGEAFDFGGVEDAVRAYATAPSWLEPLRRSSLADIEGHLVAHRFLDLHWQEISDAYQAFLKAEPMRHRAEIGSPLHSFMFWSTGIEDAPQLVRTCHATWSRALGDDGRLVTLSGEDLSEWLPLPVHLNHYRENHKVHFADWLRFALLESYGGAWLDATTYPGMPYQQFVRALYDDGTRFFAPRRVDRALATGFMWADGASHAARMTLAALDVYMRRYTEPFAYFQTHYIFAALLMRDPLFAGEFLHDSAMDGSRWQRIWIIRNRQYRGPEIRGLLRELPVHKLSYKYAENSVVPGSVLEHLLRRGTLWSRPGVSTTVQ